MLPSSAQTGSHLEPFFNAKDLQAAMDAAIDLGIRVLNPAPVVGTKGSLINFLHPKDCGGVLIELVQAK